MIENIIVDIVVGLLVAGILATIGIFFRKNLLDLVKKKILLRLTNKNLAVVYPYNIALEKMEKVLYKSKQGSMLRIICFMGKDLITERGLLNEIKIFLKDGGKAKFLIIDPQSEYVAKRARDINKDENTLRTNIRNTIININEEFKRWYPTSVEVKLYNQLPIFRVNFIDNILFLGFYSNVKNYDNLWYEIPINSALYTTLENLFMKIWEDGKYAEI
jgi:hypothetical protein